MEKFSLQSGDVGDVSSADNDFNNKDWQTVYSSEDKSELLSFVLMSLNNQINLDTENCFFRYVDNQTKEVFTF